MTIRSIAVGILRSTSYFVHLPIWLARGCHVPFSSRIGARSFLMQSQVGKYVYVGEDVYLIHTEIGNYCSIAAGTKIGGMEHSWWWGSTSPRLSDRCIYGKQTTIGDDVWMGFNVSVRQGVRIGRGAVIGSGAVVVKDVAPYAIVAGVPAREIRKRFPEETIHEIEKTQFWNYPPERAKELLGDLTYPSYHG